MTPEEQGQIPDETVEATQDSSEGVSVAKRRVATGQVKVGTVNTELEIMVVERRHF